jgi:predicted Zn finger-like uncharacterized protein
VNVSCPECRSVFRVDPTRIPATGVRARCSVCGGVIILGAGSSIEEEFGSPVTLAASGRSVGVAMAGLLEQAVVASSVEPDLELEVVAPSTPAAARPAPITSTASAAIETPAAPAPPPRRPLTPPRAAPAAPTAPAAPPRPGGAPPMRPAAFAPRVPPAMHPAAASRMAAPAAARAATPAAARAATPARPLAPPIATAFPPRPTSAPLQRTASEPPPRPASPTPSRLPINPFLANDPNAKARRLSRALISDLVTYFPQRRDEGLREGTLRELFREEIKKSYEEYVGQVGREFAESTSHFQEALNEILAGGQKIF